MRRANNLILQLCALLWLSGCTTSKHVLSNSQQKPEVQLQASVETIPFHFDTRLVRYNSRHGQPARIEVTVRVVNKITAQSPLKAVSGDIDTYNQLHEYLLNRAGQDFTLISGSRQYKPTGYFYENSYDAFPFDSFKLVFDIDKSRHPSHLALTYTDEVYSNQQLHFTF